ncbi:hypothetical protein F5Y18DRAFT_420629 [Xylariaceae sp. FL1019]|nr:hypothetical protein F5Y18DRAFT_420629 [Xylariaceae sp. FL1019]
MALVVKHLNSDASFLLSFEPIIPEAIAASVNWRPFTILLDPWISGPSTIFHSKISSSTHTQPACISSLRELTQPPDLVIIGQHKSDHCNEATLRQLPASGPDTLILAEPASARLIQSWKYFNPCMVRTLERWQDPRLTGKQSVIRIPVPPLYPGDREGEVTVAFIPQKRDITGVHSAIGITYRPPPTRGPAGHSPDLKLMTPPITPEFQQRFGIADTNPSASTAGDASFLLPPTPPVDPHSLRSIRSAAPLNAYPMHALYSPNIRPSTAYGEDNGLAVGTFGQRPISLIFSPHGISYDCLAPYATSHLVAEAALPLTALLHCMDQVDNPWWMGGNVCAGAPHGCEIAQKLGARVWISAHDGEKEVRGLGTSMLKTRRWEQEEVERALQYAGAHGEKKEPNSPKGRPEEMRKTEVMRLKSGDEMVVLATGGVWRNEDLRVCATSPVERNSPSPSLFRMTPKKSKEKRAPETMTLPKVQKEMSPKTSGLYKILKTKDLLRPSPKLVLQPETPNCYRKMIRASQPGFDVGEF